MSVARCCLFCAVPIRAPIVPRYALNEIGPLLQAPLSPSAFDPPTHVISCGIPHCIGSGILFARVLFVVLIWEFGTHVAQICNKHPCSATATPLHSLFSPTFRRESDIMSLAFSEGVDSLDCILQLA